MSTNESNALSAFIIFPSSNMQFCYNVQWLQVLEPNVVVVQVDSNQLKASVLELFFRTNFTFWDILQLRLTICSQKHY